MAVGHQIQQRSLPHSRFAIPIHDAGTTTSRTVTALDRWTSQCHLLLLLLALTVLWLLQTPVQILSGSASTTRDRARNSFCFSDRGSGTYVVCSSPHNIKYPGSSRGSQNPFCKFVCVVTSALHQLPTSLVHCAKSKQVQYHSMKEGRCIPNFYVLRYKYSTTPEVLFQGQRWHRIPGDIHTSANFQGWFFLCRPITYQCSCDLAFVLLGRTPPCHPVYTPHPISSPATHRGIRRQRLFWGTSMKAQRTTSPEP